MAASLVMVVGGAASGKSAYAQAWAEAAGPRRIYVATARCVQGDQEMVDRIELHRAKRGHGWRTLEEPSDLVGTVGREASAAPETDVLLVDCLTLWLADALARGRDAAAILQDVDGLAEALLAAPFPCAVVTNELGQGIVPENHLARRFRDLQGRANQALAARAEAVVLVTAGLPQVLKGRP